MDQATPVVDDRATLMKSWLTWMEVSRGLLPNTIRLYTRTVELCWDEVEDLPNATSETLENWVQSKGGRAGTVGNRICALNCLFRFLVKTKRRPDNPASELDRPKQHKGLPKPVRNLEEVLRKLDESDMKANQYSSIPRRIGETRDMAVFLAETGLRIHEAVALNEQVPVGETLTLIGKGYKEAILPLTQIARECLDRLEGRWPIKARATQRRFEKAGIHPHQLRHHLGCSLAASGCDLGEIQDLLRHSSPATTRTYAAYSMDRLRAAQARRVGITL